MQRHMWMLLVVGMMTGCARSANVAQEQEALLAADRAMSQTTTDVDKLMTYYAPDATVHPPGMPAVTGVARIKEVFSQMAASPGFSLQWTPVRAEVGGAGNLGYTTGTSQITMNGVTDRGKYITVWKKQADGAWKVLEDIVNSDAPADQASEHVMAVPAALKWGPAPPSMPPGGQMAIVSGDPAKAGPFVLRVQLPAGYRVAPHWHPTTENLTVLSGTLSIGMSEQMDPAVAQDLPAGGYAMLPAEMRHFAIAKTATTFQVNGTGPFAINYVNPADDPRQQK